MLILFLSLLFWHFLFDYILTPRTESRWGKVAHAYVHAAGVYIVLGTLWIAALELIIHPIIDGLAERERISRNAQQFLHLGTKVVWLALALYTVY